MLEYWSLYLTGNVLDTVPRQTRKRKGLLFSVEQRNNVLVKCIVGDIKNLTLSRDLDPKSFSLGNKTLVRCISLICIRTNHLCAVQLSICKSYLYHKKTNNKYLLRRAVI